jgi:hypothetical protein
MGSVFGMGSLFTLIWSDIFLTLSCYTVSLCCLFSLCLCVYFGGAGGGG